jgi:hypothetical protein
MTTEKTLSTLANELQNIWIRLAEINPALYNEAEETVTRLAKLKQELDYKDV